MSILVKDGSKFKLYPENLESILKYIQQRLDGRVVAAYVFGSASTGEFSADSDIDLILVVENPSDNFIKRPLEFSDLFQIYPKLDILVYSESELQRQLADSKVGFWKSVRESMKKII